MLVQVCIQFIDMSLVFLLKLLLLVVQVSGGLLLDLVKLFLELQLQVEQLVNHLCIHFLKNVMLYFVQLVDLVRVVWVNLWLVVLLSLFVAVVLAFFGITSFIDCRRAAESVLIEYKRFLRR